ncbi:MAG: CvpA family protein [Planctomycetota bacterium]|jgi:uncharacterized membrane protein required for colicin V production
MVFWIGILFGCLFVWLAVKKGFYETWILLFNIVIAVYLAVFLGPVIANIVPIVHGSAYNNALCMIIPAVGAFLILYGISFTLFTGQFSIPFTKILDTCVAGFFGFLTGLLVWFFVSLLISITPISQHTFVSELDFAGGFKQSGEPYVGWWCDLVNSIVASEDSDITSEEVINALLKNAEPKTRSEPIPSPPPDDINAIVPEDPNSEIDNPTPL